MLHTTLVLSIVPSFWLLNRDFPPNKPSALSIFYSFYSNSRRKSDRGSMFICDMYSYIYILVLSTPLGAQGRNFWIVAFSVIIFVFLGTGDWPVPPRTNY